MTDETKAPWLNYLALTTILLAVCATLATFKSGGYSSRALLSQSQASDHWAFYQSKSVKLNLYEVNQMNFLLARKALPASAGSSLVAEYDGAIEDNRKRIAKYEQEKGEIQAEARRLEKLRDDSQQHGSRFGFAVIFLQIAILLSSIAALLKKPRVWYLGMAVGAVGVVYFLNGFFLFF